MAESFLIMDCNMYPNLKDPKMRKQNVHLINGEIQDTKNHQYPGISWQPFLIPRVKYKILSATSQGEKKKKLQRNKNEASLSSPLSVGCQEDTGLS